MVKLLLVLVLTSMICANDSDTIVVFENESIIKVEIHTPYEPSTIDILSLATIQEQLAFKAAVNCNDFNRADSIVMDVKARSYFYNRRFEFIKK